MTGPDSCLNHYIDLDRYPIDQLHSTRYQTLIERCRIQMQTDCICILPGFLRSSVVSELSSEIDNLEPTAHRVDHLSTMYGWMNNTGFPPHHPRSLLLRRNCGVISTDQLDRAGHCVALFELNALTEFIRRLLNYDTLYRSACTRLAIQINVMREGEQFDWHYDTNDGVVSFMIQSPESGGQFEYVPLIRTETDENYEGVKRVVDNPEAAMRPDIPDGAFTLFMGRRSLHRVSKVGKSERSRQSLLFSYDRQPGMVFPEKTCQRLTGESSEPYLGALTEA